MPCFKLFTNLTKNEVPKDFADKIIPLLAKVVRKPASKFLCMITTDCQVSFGEESLSKGAIATLESIGNIGPEDNKIIVKEITAFVENELGINPDRFFISFYDLKAYNIGKGGLLVSEMNN